MRHLSDLQLRLLANVVMAPGHTKQELAAILEEDVAEISKAIRWLFEHGYVRRQYSRNEDNPDWYPRSAGQLRIQRAGVRA